MCLQYEKMNENIKAIRMQIRTDGFSYMYFMLEVYTIKVNTSLMSTENKMKIAVILISLISPGVCRALQPHAV